MSAATDGLVCDKAGETKWHFAITVSEYLCYHGGRRRCDLSGQLYDMIISHEQQFIFLKTRKTAGTSIELALSDLCGARDIITPLLPRDDEALRANGRGAQNWRLHGWWQESRPFLRRRFFKFTAQDYGFVLIPAEEAKALLNDDKVWRNYFKFAFDRNPWDRQSPGITTAIAARTSARLPPLFIRTDGRASTITRSIRLAGSLRSILSDASKL